MYFVVPVDIVVKELEEVVESEDLQGHRRDTFYTPCMDYTPSGRRKMLSAVRTFHADVSFIACRNCMTPFRP